MSGRRPPSRLWLVGLLSLVWVACEAHQDRVPLLTAPPATPEEPSVSDEQQQGSPRSEVRQSDERDSLGEATSLAPAVVAKQPCPPVECVDRQPASTPPAALLGTWCTCEGEIYATFMKSSFRASDGIDREYTLDPPAADGSLRIHWSGLAHDIADPLQTPGMLRIRFVDIVRNYYRSKSDNCDCFRDAAKGQVMPRHP